MIEVLCLQDYGIDVPLTYFENWIFSNKHFLSNFPVTDNTTPNTTTNNTTTNTTNTITPPTSPFSSKNINASSLSSPFPSPLLMGSIRDKSSNQGSEEERELGYASISEETVISPTKTTQTTPRTPRSAVASPRFNPLQNLKISPSFSTSPSHSNSPSFNSPSCNSPSYNFVFPALPYSEGGKREVESSLNEGEETLTLQEMLLLDETEEEERGGGEEEGRSYFEGQSTRMTDPSTIGKESSGRGLHLSPHLSPHLSTTAPETVAFGGKEEEEVVVRRGKKKKDAVVEEGLGEKVREMGLFLCREVSLRLFSISTDDTFPLSSKGKALNILTQLFLSHLQLANILFEKLGRKLGLEILKSGKEEDKKDLLDFLTQTVISQEHPKLLFHNHISIEQVTFKDRIGVGGSSL